MLRMILNKGLAVLLIAVVTLLLRPSEVLANDGCNLLSLIFGGDCVSTIDAGMTERVEIEEVNATNRVLLEQTGLTDRVLLEQAGLTDRTMLEQMQETQRTLLTTEAMRDIASQQTTQVLANALAAQNNVDRLASATENVVLYQVNYDLLRQQLAQQAYQRWLDRLISVVTTIALITLLSGIFLLLYLRRRNQHRPQVFQPQLPAPHYYASNQIVKVSKGVYIESEL